MANEICAKKMFSLINYFIEEKGKLLTGCGLDQLDIKFDEIDPDLNYKTADEKEDALENLIYKSLTYNDFLGTKNIKDYEFMFDFGCEPDLKIHFWMLIALYEEIAWVFRNRDDILLFVSEDDFKNMVLGFSVEIGDWVEKLILCVENGIPNDIPNRIYCVLERHIDTIEDVVRSTKIFH
jgi:hypothetical protein